MMEIWEERYNQNKYGLERPASYKYFKQYLKMGRNRSIKKLSEKLSDNPSNKTVSYKTLREYSCKWEWNMRAEAYDQYLDEQLEKEFLELASDFKQTQLTNAKERIQYILNSLDAIESDNDLSNKDKAYSIAKLQEAYQKNIESFYLILNDGVKVTSKDLNANVKAEPSTEELIQGLLGDD